MQEGNGIMFRIDWETGQLAYQADAQARLGELIAEQDEYAYFDAMSSNDADLVVAA